MTCILPYTVCQGKIAHVQKSFIKRKKRKRVFIIMADRLTWFRYFNANECKLQEYTAIQVIHYSSSALHQGAVNTHLHFTAEPIQRSFPRGHGKDLKPSPLSVNSSLSQAFIQVQTNGKEAKPPSVNKGTSKLLYLAPLSHRSQSSRAIHPLLYFKYKMKRWREMVIEGRKAMHN